METRRDKLTFLENFLTTKDYRALDETARVPAEVFQYENLLYMRALRKKRIDRLLWECARCPGLNIEGVTEVCPGWGDLCARVFVIGQSAHRFAVRTDLPFIKGSGYLLDLALRCSELLRKDIFITNVVHCHPPQNRDTTTQEKKNCLPFLKAEVELVQPGLIIALGNDAKWAVGQLGLTAEMKKKTKDRSFNVLCVEHPAAFLHRGTGEFVKNWIVQVSLAIDKVYK